jgi:hypothetical protein
MRQQRLAVLKNLSTRLRLLLPSRKLQHFMQTRQVVGRQLIGVGGVALMIGLGVK